MLSSAWMPTSRASPDILASRDLANPRALQILLCHNMNSEFTFFYLHWHSIIGEGIVLCFSFEENTKLL